MFAQIRHSNGMRIDQSIDPATMMARPLSVNVFQGDGSAISYAGPYDFDGAGNIKAIGASKLYRYDGVSRLIESRETWGSATYVQKPTFDAWGNIQELETGPMGSTQVLSTPTSSTTNRLTTAGTQYDAEGNLVLWNSGPSYEYDAFNRMRRFRGGVAPGSEEWVFAYTADDERVFSARVGGGGTVWSLRGLDNQLLREWRAEDGKHSFRDYVWTGRNLLAKIERTPAAGSPGWSEETRHAAVDHLGSVRLWTDAGGANLPGFIYYPFGKQLNGTVDDEQMRFTGHERDLWNTTSSNDDLDYMHARHYNPQLGRFLQIDPLAGSVSAPQSLNRYAYVLGNPLSFTDPEGLSADANATGCPMPYIWITDHWGCNQGGGGGGISRSLLLWFISRWFNNPGTGGDGDFPWGGGGRPGTPTGSPTNPTDPGDGPGDGPGNDDGDGPCSEPPRELTSLERVASFSAGFGDALLLGLGHHLRGANGSVDMASASYSVGQLAGGVALVAAGGWHGIRAAGAPKAGLEFSHWIPARFGGPRSILNGNFVTRGAHALSDPYRYRFMSRLWKSQHPLPSAARQQWARLPKVGKGAAGGALAGGAAKGGC